MVAEVTGSRTLGVGEDLDRCEEVGEHTCVRLSEVALCLAFLTCEVDRREQSGVHRQ